MSSPLWFVCETYRIVWTYAPISERRWQFCRTSPCQRAKNAFVLCWKPKEDMGWAVQNQTVGLGHIIGQPVMSLDSQTEQQPPVGRWVLWGNPYRLVEQMPQSPPPLARQSRLDLPIGVLNYLETGNIARIHVTMKSAAITDEILEQSITWFAGILRNLAQRVSMHLLISADCREASLPSIKHVRRFLAFMQEMGPEIVLCGRGSVYVLQATGFLGSAKLAVIRWVQQRLPAPWPEDIVASIEEGDSFLANIEAEILKLLAAPPFSIPIAASAPPEEPTPEATAALVADPSGAAGRGSPTRGDITTDSIVAEDPLGPASDVPTAGGASEVAQPVDVVVGSSPLETGLFGEKVAGPRGDIVDTEQVRPSGSSSFCLCRCAEWTGRATL